MTSVLESLYPHIPQRHKNALKQCAAFGRRIVPTPRMQPDFLVIGAQKSGTSSLFKYLIRHGGYLRPLLKDIYYFDNNYDKGLDWYLSYFPSLSAKRALAQRTGGPIVTGEGATYYLLHPWAPRRVRESFPDMRLIVLLRDPVRRAISHYHHNRRSGVETAASPLEAFEREAERLDDDAARLMRDPDFVSPNHQHFSYLARGRYAEQLSRWLEHFPREQLLILCSERFYADTDRHFREVCRFIAIPEVSLDAYRPEGQGNYREKDQRAVDYARAYFSRHNEALYDLIGDRYDWPS